MCLNPTGEQPANANTAYKLGTEELHVLRKSIRFASIFSYTREKYVKHATAQ